MDSITRDRLMWAAGGFFSAVLIIHTGLIFTIRNTVVREFRSPETVDATVQTIFDNASAKGWVASEPPILGPDQGAASKAPVRVVELSKPDYVANMVAYGRNRSVAVAPTTLVVYEKGGVVYVASVNNALIGRFFHHEPAGAMQQKEVDERQIMGFLAKR